MYDEDEQPSAVYISDGDEGTAVSADEAKAKVWSPDDARKALKDRQDAPEVDDAFTPVPPEEHHPQGKQMSPRPPVPPEVKNLSSKDLWKQAEELAEQRKQEYNDSLEQSSEAAAVAEPERPQPEEDSTYVSERPQPEEDSTYVLEVTQPQPVMPHTTDVEQIKQEQREKLIEELGADLDALKKIAAYLKQKCRVTLELQDGTFSMPVIDSVTSTYSISLIVPVDDDTTTFIPKPGTEVKLTCQEVTKNVYYPGAYTEIPVLSVAVMTFIRTDADYGKA